MNLFSKFENCCNPCFFLLTMDHMMYVKVVTRSDEPTEYHHFAVPLSFQSCIVSFSSLFWFPDPGFTVLSLLS